MNSLLYLTMMGETYVKTYEKYISQLQMYAKAIRVLLKGYLPISILPPSNLQEILVEFKKAIQIAYPDYNAWYWIYL